MVHPEADAGVSAEPDPADGRALLAWMGARDARGVEAYRARLPRHPLVPLPLLADEPNDLVGVERVRAELVAGWTRAAGALHRNGGA